MFLQAKSPFFFLLIWFSSAQSKSIIYANDGNNQLKFLRDENVFSLSHQGVLNLEKSFVNSSSITHLYLTDNDLCVINAGAFDGLPNLVYLNLTRNNYITLQLHGSNFPRIETLVLDDTAGVNKYHCTINRGEFGDLSRGSCYSTPIMLNFKKLPNLRHLYLRNNGLDYLRNNFQPIIGQVGSQIYRSGITHLYLDNNNISSLNFVDSLPESITHLYLRNNSLTDLDYSFVRLAIPTSDPLPLDRLRNLVHLDLSKNQISALSDDSFNNLEKLIILELDENYLSHVPRICELKSLEILSISQNQLTEIAQFDFCGLSSLRMLNLSHNEITKISQDEIRNLGGLESLDLSGNKIAYLPQNWIAEMNLKALFLNDNRFKHFSHLSLNAFGSLKYVNIRGNDIKVNGSMGLPRDTVIAF